MSDAEKCKDWFSMLSMVFLHHVAAVGSVRKEALPANPGLNHASPQGRVSAVESEPSLEMTIPKN